MRHLSLVPILFAILIVAPLAAQDIPADTGWPVEQHCIGDPTPPPADWTYDGTIYFYNSTGIRGLSSHKTTPYIILDQDFIEGAALSPDGKWYAFPKGHREPANAGSEDYLIDTISVHSTTQDWISYEVPWDWIFQYALSPSNDISYVKWIDNTHLVYIGTKKDKGGQYVNPFTGDSKNIDGYIDWGTASLSPDLELAVYDDSYGYNPNWGLYDLRSGDLIRLLGYDENIQYARGIPILWTPDSSYFFAELGGLVKNGDTILESLVQFNRAGELDQIIFSIEDQMGFGFSISPDGQYIAVDSMAGLYIVDLQTEQVWDTCHISVEGIAWSPTGQQLAFSTYSDIVVLDMQSWQQYKLASNQGDVLSWGAAE